ncbi:hypothetical protein PG994_004327 [Apiospora phragmitis]|uniref:F-box domain-containing protein n=1 Tax=Apiospora phragmitis TaxID=2905665 RepID=A0ABR1VUB2_9PEZI
MDISTLLALPGDLQNKIFLQHCDGLDRVALRNTCRHLSEILPQPEWRELLEAEFNEPGAVQRFIRRLLSTSKYFTWSSIPRLQYAKCEGSQTWLRLISTALLGLRCRGTLQSLPTNKDRGTLVTIITRGRPLYGIRYRFGDFDWAPLSHWPELPETLQRLLSAHTEVMWSR